ncbi:MAG: hypothetical protein AAF940_00910 [Pseudomonadota bacterium]
MTSNVFSIAFDPIIPWLGVWIALAIALALSALILVLRLRGSVLRSLAALALVAAIANPIFVNEERSSLPTTVALVVDRSQSQRLQERMPQTDRALEALQENLERFPQFDVRVVEAGNSSSTAPSTELFSALQGALRDVPPSQVGGAIFITDGEVHDVPADPQALGLEAPLHALITGQPDEFDRQVRLTQAPRFAIVGTPFEMTYQVRDFGQMPQDATNGPIEVEVSVNGTLVAIEQVTPDAQFPVTITLDRAGPNIVEFSVAPVDGEITETNNRAFMRVEGIRENLRVLLVSGEPHSGERTWRNLLKSDASVDLVHFTILRPPEKQDGTPINELSLIAFPTRELFVEKIDDFDLIIFDRYQNRNVLPTLYYDYIAQYVRNGGALLVASGPEFATQTSVALTPLVTALPAQPTGQVIEAGFYPRLTDAGERHPVTRGLEGSRQEPPQWGRWFRTVSVVGNAGTTVMRSVDENPLLILDEFGDGRVGLMLSDHGWLWARGFEGGGPHVGLYRRLAHWLMKEPDLEEEALTAESGSGELTVRRQTMADTVEPLRVLLPSGETLEVQMVQVGPGLWEARIETDEIGLVELTNGDLTTLAHLGRTDAPEFADMISTVERLEPVSDEIGGTVRRLVSTTGQFRVPNILPVRSTSEADGRGWIGLKTSDESRLEGVSQTSLFSGFLGLALLMFALSSMWYREGR